MDHHFFYTPFPALVLTGSYFLGSIPFGFLFTKWAGRGDVRQIGSGNIGATNVLRAGNKFLALLTFLCDSLKGYGAVYLGALYQIHDICAVAVVLGHMFPLWLRFKGGKGVATYGGCLFALSVPLGSQAVLSWFSFALLFGYSSLAALITVVLIPFTVWIWSYGEHLLMTTLILGCLLILKHYENIKRLIAGKEPKIGGGVE